MFLPFARRRMTTFDEDFNKLVKRSADWQLLLLSSDGSGTGSFPSLFRFSFNFYSFSFENRWTILDLGFISVSIQSAIEFPKISNFTMKIVYFEAIYPQYP